MAGPALKKGPRGKKEMWPSWARRKGRKGEKV
jgi:hypothetical protein